MDTTTTETGQAVPVNVPANSIPQPIQPTQQGPNVMVEGGSAEPTQSFSSNNSQTLSPQLEHKEDQPTPYQAITDLKDKGDALIAHIKKHGSSNELSKAVAKIEEGIMWAIKHLGNML